MDPLAQALSHHFGYSAFRAGQRPVIEGILAGRPVVAVMPTGQGKSLCYQLPALMLDGVTLVISPLIALMKDQVDALRARGIPAAYVNSSMDHGQQRQVLEDAAAGHLKLLYLSPERFRFAGAMAAIRRIPVSLFAVDEAHCMSHWGRDFRPDYANLGAVVTELGVPRVAAFTATATAHARGDIVDTLRMRDPLVMVAGFMRDNLHLTVLPVRRMKEKKDHMVRLLRERGGAAVVYCATRKHCDEVASHLRASRLEPMVYHGGLDDETRATTQDRFLREEAPIMVATNAFGMGVDKPNVRVVVHYDIPGSVDAYYQEAGRAGRDGEPARCVLLFTYADTRIHEFFISNVGQDLPAPERAALMAAEETKLKAMVRYAYEERCRHGAILRYFGESLSLDEDGCGACDNCTGETGVPGLRLSADAGARKTTASDKGPASDEPRGPLRTPSEDEAVIVQKVLSAVARSQGRLAPTSLAQLLRGHATMLQDPLATSKSFGLLASMGQTQLTTLIRALGRAGCTTGRRPELTPLGTEVMWRRKDVMLDLPPFSEGAAPAPAGASLVDPDAKALFDRLREARQAAASERGVPAYVIASNKVLEALSVERPQGDRHAWLTIKGVGPNNVDGLREVFLPVLEASAE